MNSSNRLQIREIVSENLALRDLATEFFDKIDSMKEKEVIIDFKKVRSISRSFAQEYLLRKKESKKKIIEANVPENVKKMFEIINQQQKTTPLIDLKTIKAISV